MTKEQSLAASASIVKKPLGWFKPAAYNPRKDLQPGDRQYQELKKSITHFGHVQVLVANKNGTLIGGHQTLKVLTDLGVKDANTVILNLNEQDEKTLNIALNKIEGEWDPRKLAEILVELDAADVDLSLAGFDTEELKELVDEQGLGSLDDSPEGEKPYTDEEIVEDALGWLRKAGFPYPHLEVFEMKQAINKLALLPQDQCPRSTAAYQVADTFHPHRFHASAIGMKSPVWGFQDDVRVKVALKMELDAGAIRRGYLGAFNLVSRVQPCANFRPAFAKMIWTKYGGKDGVCFDPSMGYGGRLVGFLASPCKTYIGTDPNPPTFKGDQEIVKALGAGRDIKLYDKPVEDLDVRHMLRCADIAFTSPPYFSKEIYSDDDTQSWKRYPTYDGWLDGFLTRMIEKCWDVLKPGGHMVLNIEDVKIKGKDYALVEPTVERAKKAGFVLAGREAFPIPKSVHNAVLNEETREYDADEIVDESLLVFQKPKKGGKKK